MVSTACGHPFCAECWKTYIVTAIKDGVGCLNLLCPEPDCIAAVGVDIVDRVATAEERENYYKYLNHSYVKRSRERKWCPAPGCDRAVEFDSDSESYDVVCDCSHTFCWSCGEESHRPVAAAWMDKCAQVVGTRAAVEALSTKWISSFAKGCRKCNRPIQKTNGCNHMKCPPPCEFEFCWECLMPWENHGRCNMMKAKEKKKEEAASLKPDILRESLTHYYEKWASNDKLLKWALHCDRDMHGSIYC